MEFGLLLRLDSLINLISILSHLISIQWRESYLCNFVKKKRKKNFYIGLCLYLHVGGLIVSFLPVVLSCPFSSNFNILMDVSFSSTKYMTNIEVKGLCLREKECVCVSIYVCVCVCFRQHKCRHLHCFSDNINVGIYTEDKIMMFVLFRCSN